MDVVANYSLYRLRERVLGPNRIKTPARIKLSVARLELLMRLFLSYRKQGVDPTKRLDVLREAAVIFDYALARRK